MVKNLSVILLCFVVSLSVFAGCHTDSETFDAKKFVDQCNVLLTYDEKQGTDGFCMDYVQTVFKEYGDSDFYSDATDEERCTEVLAIAEVLESYSYGPIQYGFIRDYSLDKSTHTLNWRFTQCEYGGSWTMPGY